MENDLNQLNSGVAKALVICGSPGAGKSTYGRKLAAAQSAVLLDIDTCSEKLVMAGMKLGGHDPYDRDSRIFKSTFRDAIYETLFDIAVENLVHQSVVIVGPFTKEIRNPDWLNLLQRRLNTTYIEVHYVYCEPQLRKTRIIHRKNPRDEGKFGDYDVFNQYYGDEKPPSFPHIFINTSDSETL